MSAKVFIDTNLLIYLYSEDEPGKRESVITCLEAHEKCFISVQVVNELCNVLIKKFGRNAN